MNKERKKPLPIIIPLVIYHGVDKWNTSLNLGDLLLGYHELPENLKVYVPNFDYLLYNVSVYTDEEIKGKAKTKILLTLLRDIFTKDGDKLEESIIRSIHYLNELEDRQTGTEYLETIMRYIFSAGKSLTKRNINKMIRQIEIAYPEGSEVAMTLAEMWMEEGREQGIEQGREQGGAAALSETAIQLLIEKFGKVPQDMKEAILKSDTVTLKLVLFNIFRYESVEDVRKYIQ